MTEEIEVKHQEVENGEAKPEEVADEEKVEAQVDLPPVVVRIPSPSHPRTLPKPSAGEDFSTISLLPQPTETIQDLKLAVNEFIGGYWLGPYSLRFPASGSNRGELLGKGRDGVEVRAGEKLSEWLEVGDVFAHLAEGDDRVLEVVREPYSDFSARQTVLRLVELISPPGTTSHTLTTPIGLQPGSTIFQSVRDGDVSALGGSSEPVYEEVEVALPSGRKGKAGKKEMVKVKREVTTAGGNAFSDWKGDGPSISLGKLPMSQPLMESLPCVKSISMSPFNPPPPQLRQLGHQIYLLVSLLEGETVTLICTSRGWYVSKSNVNNFDPSPRPNADGSIPRPTHSILDLLHSLSPQFTERLSHLAPLTSTPPTLEPISTVPVPQTEPAYPWLATLPKLASTPDILRTQLAYLHTGATSAENLDAARDWNEEIQGIRELPREGMQERVLREKMAQKTWAEYTQACIRGVLSIARGDIVPINPNEDARGHMWLCSNIFFTKAVDSIDAYAHLGGDAAAHVSHAKDAQGVRLLNKLDVEGIHLLGHTVVDWQGERWVCQSMLPGIFSRRNEEEEKEDSEEKDDKEEKEDWVKVSPSKSTKSTEEDEPAENPLIIYGMDSEHLTALHWDKGMHKLMEKVATAQRLASHKMKDGKGEEKEFWASAEVKGLRGSDGRRYLLDLPRISPVDIEFLEKDLGGKMLSADKADGPEYPHRVVLLRPELVETFWESELKRWARGVAASQAKKEEETKEESKDDSKEETTEEGAGIESDKANGETSSPAEAAAVAQRAEDDKPVDTSVVTDQIKQFELRLNADAFVDHAPAKGSDNTVFVPSTITDETDPSIKAVRDASVFLRSIAIPAVALDVLTGTTSGIMDGASLSKHLHARGVNMRYLGHLAATLVQFSAAPEGKPRAENGYLEALKTVVHQEMVFRASKHILRRLVRDLQPEHVPCAVSHFLNCLLGIDYNSSPSAVYDAIDFAAPSEPEYVSLSPELLRSQIISEVQTRFRWTLDEEYLTTGLRKTQLLRELATRFAFQLLQRDYAFSADAEVPTSEDDNKKDKKSKKVKTTVRRQTAFEPSDILTMIPIVKSTAPTATVAEEIFEAGRNTINRGNMDLGLEFMLEAITLYESIHSVLHPEVAAAYNQYASTLHQLARIKIQQMAAENADPEQPLGLDVATGLRLQRQAVIVAERTIGVYSAETATYYFQLALLENLEGNYQAALRCFRHLLGIWEVIYGGEHPEINTVLSNAGVVLQALSENASSLQLLSQAHKSTTKLFGETHLQTGQTFHQLTQAHFLTQDIASALSTAESALAIFTTHLGAEHAQTKETGKNVELLKAVVENMERQKQASEAMKESQKERLRLAKERVAGGGLRKRVALGGVNNVNGSTPETGVAGGSSGPGTIGASASSEEKSTIGEKGHLDVDDLVKFIQGQGAPTKPSSRGKNSLRGKRRTGAKR